MRKGAVVITGASTGIGRATALLLDQAGYQVFAGVRSEEAANALRQQASGALLPITIDVTRPDVLAAAAGQMTEILGPERGLAGLVNTAACVISGPLEFVPLDDIRQQLDVNLVGQVAAIQAFLPLIRHGHGRIINIGTSGWRVGPAFLGPYVMSKAGVDIMTHVLRRELQPWSIPVSVVEPGPVDTEFWDKALKGADAMAASFSPAAYNMYDRPFANGRRAILRMRRRGIPPEEAAKVLLAAMEIERPKPLYYVGLYGGLVGGVSRLLPTRLIDWVTAKILCNYSG